MSKPMILVDLDGVLVDLVRMWLDEYWIAGGEHLYPKDIYTYDFAKIVKQPELFHQQLTTKPILRWASSLRNTSGFAEMCDLFDVRIVTYVNKSNPNGFEQKLGWLEMYFPWFDTDKVYFARNKEIIRGTVLIEDNPEMIEKWLALNPYGRAICIQAAYNDVWRSENETNNMRAAYDITEALAILKEWFQ